MNKELLRIEVVKDLFFHKMNEIRLTKNPYLRFKIG